MINTRTVTDMRAYSVQELARLYPISLGFLRGEIRRGALRVRRFGRRVLVLKEDWDGYIAKADVESTPGQPTAKGLQ
jgi:excisionase family DNA binding protein